MKKLKLFFLISSFSRAQKNIPVIQPRTDSPDHLRFIGITDANGHSEFVYTNTVKEECVSSSSSKCYDVCRFSNSKADFYTNVECRLCLVRWKCLDLENFRKCGKNKCHEMCHEELAPKEIFGIPSRWRQEQCLSCMIQKKCATEYDLQMHYGYTVDCASECASNEANNCPSIPAANSCKATCDGECRDSDSSCHLSCFRRQCPETKESCVNCIESCSATKILVEAHMNAQMDRSVMEFPILKARFTKDYMRAHDLIPTSAPKPQKSKGRERVKGEKDKSKRKLKKEKRKEKKAKRQVLQAGRKSKRRNRKKTRKSKKQQQRQQNQKNKG